MTDVSEAGQTRPTRAGAASGARHRAAAQPRGGAAARLATAGIAAIAAIVAALAPAPAAAAEDAGDQPADLIIVTGSLIADAALPRASPVLRMAGADLELRGSDSIEEALRQLPGVVPAVGSAVNNGNDGTASVNLRGLGSNRNLVLVDGNRLTPAGLDGEFDLNNVPAALIARIDVLTGGASTTYGADAISGVVNLLLRRDFQGIELSASSGISSVGDGASVRSDLLLGRNFGGGRGNLTLALGYLRRDAVSQGARGFSATSIDSATGQPTGSPVGVPAILSAVSDAGADFIATGCGGGTSVPCATGGQGPRQIAADGGAFSPVALYAPYDVNPLNLLQTPFERVNAMALGHYELTDAVELSVRGIYSHNRVQTQMAPSGAFTTGVAIPLSNPFLTPRLRAGLCQYDINPGPGYVPLLSAADCAAAAAASGPGDPAFRVVPQAVLRRADELGPRQSVFTTDYVDVLAGLHGPLAGKLRWDVEFSWGESRRSQRQSGYWSMARLQQALLAGPDGCFDPSGGCVPVDLFGPAGSITPEMNDFLAASATSRTRTSMWQAKARLSGDTGLRLPGADAPVAIALDAEYRRLSASRASDPLLLAGDLGGSSGADPDVAGHYAVAELAGEALLPLLADRPGVHRLGLDLGVRYSRTRVAAGSGHTTHAVTWKAGGDWEVVAGVALRASWASAIRAPNVGELFFPTVRTPINLSFDPCAGVAPLLSDDLRAVCLAQGAQASQIGSIPQPALGQVAATTGGNPDLRPEKSRSWTFGLRLAPPAWPGFRASVDYYQIRVRDAIALPSVVDVLTGCFAELTPASAGSESCRAIQRNPATGALDTGAPGVVLPLANLGDLETSGIDLSLAWATEVASDVRLGLTLTGNWTDRLRARSPQQAWRECAGHYSVSCDSIQPRVALQQQTVLSFPTIDLALNWRLLGRVSYEPRQYAEDVAQAAASGCRDPGGADPDGCVIDPAFRQIPLTSYFDFTARARIGSSLALTLTVFNLLDHKPPIVGGTVGVAAFNSGNTYPSTYDALGRRFRVGAQLRF